MTYVLEFLQTLYYLFIDMSYYLFIGLIFVGLLHIYMSNEFVSKHLGANSLWSVIKASLFGVPLPLCSCGVIPTGLQLKKSGASNGSVISFLTSTPQTGIDSMVATYGLLGLPFAIFRPFAAFTSGVIGGIIVNMFPQDTFKLGSEEKIVIESCEDSCCSDEKEDLDVCHDSCCSDNTSKDNMNSDDTDSCGGDSCGCSCSDEKPDLDELGFKKSTVKTLKEIYRYAFDEFLGDITKDFVVGLVLAAVITLALPEDFFVSLSLSSPLLLMLLMILIGLPLYICSTSSIPIAIALMLKGISPGAAFVFLFAGPVTNIASIMILKRSLGTKLLSLYLVIVSVLAIIFGLLLDFLFNTFDLSVKLIPIVDRGEFYTWYQYLIAFIMFIIIGRLLFRQYGPRKKTHIHEHNH